MAPRRARKLSNWDKVRSLLWPQNRVKKILFIALAVLVCLLIVTSSVLAYADSTHRGEMFPNTTVLGVDVSGMEKEVARQRVTEEAVAPLQQPITLVFKDRNWTIDPAELGLEVDVDAMIEEAYRDGWGRSVFERAWRRTFNQPLDIQVGLSYSMDSDALLGKLQDITGEVNQEPKDAALTFDSTSGKLTYYPSREGRKVDMEASAAAVGQAMLTPDQKTAELVVAITRANLSDEDVQTVLVVDIMGNTLKHYVKDQLAKTYYVATGLPKYPTPLGKYYIIRKEHDPVWVNPNVEWSKTMPPTIPAGPDNPLGMRAMVTSAAGGTVLIHGTRNLNPGLYSHGCIRMANASVEELYEYVQVGTPVFIWTSKPVPPPPPDEPPAAPEDPGLAQ